MKESGNLDKKKIKEIEIDEQKREEDKEGFEGNIRDEYLTPQTEHEYAKEIETTVQKELSSVKDLNENPPPLDDNQRKDIENLSRKNIVRDLLKVEENLISPELRAALIEFSRANIYRIVIKDDRVYIQQRASGGILYMTKDPEEIKIMKKILFGEN